ncbi:hypothetical protein K469DRAFT_721387 [Zopfia rhizophila CBS 207.26]|uniref:Uncharacterized protein n=1 Tax=Zopfia rhizophila CBS 207.26 TaxID=1314779 RepID=A0A6A6EI34_9PEZI|nr:hypothetical protein K469DRAFT_721387 [Zopfia rhizophila CBS 207.26]
MPLCDIQSVLFAAVINAKTEWASKIPRDAHFSPRITMLDPAHAYRNLAFIQTTAGSWLSPGPKPLSSIVGFPTGPWSSALQCHKVDREYMPDDALHRGTGTPHHRPAISNLLRTAISAQSASRYPGIALSWTRRSHEYHPLRTAHSCVIV